MMAKDIELPHSKVTIRFTSEFDREKLAELARRLILDEKLANRMQKDPTKELARLGILIDKYRLEQGEATSREEKLTTTELDREIQQRLDEWRRQFAE